MPSPFPGMDPYLEKPGLWKQVCTELIVDIQRFLVQQIRPKYLVAIEQRTFVSMPVDEPSDPKMTVPADGSYTVLLPDVKKVKERFLTVRDAETSEVLTVLEILSHSAKVDERKRYERRRLHNFYRLVNLVEIDLLRIGESMPMYGDFPDTAYRILVSRAMKHPRAQLFACTLRQPLPDIPIPLRPGEDEPPLPLNQILHALYDSSGYDSFINYSQPLVPPLEEEDAVWARALLLSAGQ